MLARNFSRRVFLRLPTYSASEKLNWLIGFTRIGLFSITYILTGSLDLFRGSLIVEERAIACDVLVLALGSRANDFGTLGVAQHCHFIDSQIQAEAFNATLRAKVTRAVVQDEALRVAIVGGGATGVELAAELSHLLEIASNYGDPAVRGRLELTLLESGSRLLSAFPPAISASTEELLRKIGFQVQTGKRVTAAASEGLTCDDGSAVPADLMVWAAGVKAPDFLTGIDGLETNRSHQVIVRPTLQAIEEDRIFALGDCASLQLPESDRPLPPTAQVATQQAMHLARHLPRWLKGERLPDFGFRDYGSLVSLGDYNAFGTLGRYGLFRGGFIQGRFAQFSHAMLYRRHQQALHGLPKATMLWLAERINGIVQPRIRMS
ncbi:FAD-dependent oxidoreductase [Achromobacter pulmonis]|uniref:FAD-dependent oxidoreductase n=1 Tax=Achromobacter pulmonis TaxID=1389932 RepID=A0A2N8K9I6_9BURK|nr:FAD-dependent oxidoreductase [Achromobacter pulmonis]